MIPKKLHIIWVGDESKRPDNCIQTWIDKNPAWTVRADSKVKCNTLGFNESRWSAAGC